MKDIQVFVINLEESHERRTFITEQFKSFPHIPYQIFKAVNGKEKPDYPLFEKYNEQERLKRKGHKMNSSQLGCWASHYHLWEKCIELNQGIIILEDDSIIHSHFNEVYEFICSAQNQFEFLWLSPAAPRVRYQKGKTIQFLPNSFYKVARFYKSWRNTTGYFITPQAAQKLLNFAKQWVYEVDITIDRYWENKIDYLAITPACVEADFSKESNIPVNKGTSNRDLSTKVRREVYKFIDNINKFIYNFRL